MLSVNALLNANAKALLKLRPMFYELTKDDIPTNDENHHAGSDDESDEEKAELPKAIVDVESDEEMED